MNQPLFRRDPPLKFLRTSQYGFRYACAVEHYRRTRSPLIPINAAIATAVILTLTYLL